MVTGPLPPETIRGNDGGIVANATFAVAFATRTTCCVAVMVGWGAAPIEGKGLAHILH